MAAKKKNGHRHQYTQGTWAFAPSAPQAKASKLYERPTGSGDPEVRMLQRAGPIIQKAPLLVPTGWHSLSHLPSTTG